MLRRRPRLTTALALLSAAAVVSCAGANQPAEKSLHSGASQADDASFASDAPASDAPSSDAAAAESDDNAPSGESSARRPAQTAPTTTSTPPPSDPAPPPPVTVARPEPARAPSPDPSVRNRRDAVDGLAALGGEGRSDPKMGGKGPPMKQAEEKPKELAEQKAKPKAEADKRLAEPEPEATASKGGTFVHAGTNPFIETATDALSTFAIDVDTGSFTFARRYLRQAQLPPDAAIRVEEWVNAMHYSYEGPTKGSSVPFSVLVQGAPSPIAKNTHLVRVALQGKRVSKQERGPTSLVFLADVSGSMDASDKLPLARDAMHLLIEELRDDDSVAIATYAGETRLALSSTTIKGNKSKIHAAIDTLHSGGGTNMGSGMELAYREAQKGLGGGRSARVVVMSDGDVNIGRLSHQDILKSIRGYVSEGVMMSTVGFGTGNYNDNLMEQLANAGNGNYSYIDSKKTAERVFVHELDGTLETIAQDVKIQVEWNKDVVTKYRLVGYENRDVADRDFRNDKKDAGEIGAGHAVTALYELELSSTSPSANLGTVRVRAKKPRGTKADEIAVAITAGSLRERPNDLDHDAQTAVAVALAAEILRGSPYAEGRTLGEAASLLREAAIGPHAAERLELARELMLVEPRVARR